MNHEWLPLRRPVPGMRHDQILHIDRVVVTGRRRRLKSLLAVGGGVGSCVLRRDHDSSDGRIDKPG